MEPNASEMKILRLSKLLLRMVAPQGVKLSERRRKKLEDLVVTAGLIRAGVAVVDGRPPLIATAKTPAAVIKVVTPATRCAMRVGATRCVMRVAATRGAMRVGAIKGATKVVAVRVGKAEIEATTAVDATLVKV